MRLAGCAGSMARSCSFPDNCRTHRQARPGGCAILFFNPTGPNFTWELWRVSMRGGPPERLGPAAANVYRPALSPDGRHLVFLGRVNQPGGVFAIDRVPAAKLTER